MSSFKGENQKNYWIKTQTHFKFTLFKKMRIAIRDTLINN